MDPSNIATAATAASSFTAQHGFNAGLVVTLLGFLWKMLAAERADRQAREARDEQRELARRAEREADRAAHMAAFERLTSAVGELRATVAPAPAPRAHAAAGTRR